MKRNSEAPASETVGKKPKLDVAALKARLNKDKAKLKQTTQAVAAAQPVQETPAAASAAQDGLNSNGLQQDAPRGMQAPAALMASAPAQPSQDEDISLYDSSIRMKKRKPGLSLFQIGAVPKEFQQAIEERKAQGQALDGTGVASTSAAADDVSMAMAVGDDDDLEPPPDMEWWDAAVFAQATYDVEEGAEVSVREGKLTDLVEHPIPIEPPVEAPRAVPQPLMLTKKEMKKMRKQRREEREKEKQQNIQLGLMEAPSDKVRLSNMARVFGADGVLDATAIELRVRKAQEERHAAHEDRNAARKLTTSERKAKQLRKMFDENACDVHVQVFKVLRLDDGRNQYKVEINATENRLTGVCIVNESGLNLVVVEGDPKGMRRFNRLMLHRIDWNPMLNVDEVDEDTFEQEVNRCHLVWQGTVAQGAFEDFKKHKVESAVEGRAVLATQGVAQYWDAAQSFVADTWTAA